MTYNKILNLILIYYNLNKKINQNCNQHKNIEITNMLF